MHVLRLRLLKRVLQLLVDERVCRQRVLKVLVLALQSVVVLLQGKVLFLEQVGIRLKLLLVIVWVCVLNAANFLKINSLEGVRSHMRKNRNIGALDTTVANAEPYFRPAGSLLWRQLFVQELVFLFNFFCEVLYLR